VPDQEQDGDEEGDDDQRSENELHGVEDTVG
jgi:hypothetical protein